MGIAFHRVTASAQRQQGLRSFEAEPNIASPVTLSLIFIVGSLDSLKVVSTGGSLRYLVVGFLLLTALWVDAGGWRLPALGNRRVAGVLFLLGLWLTAIWVAALMSGGWSNDTGVYLWVGPLLLLLPLWMTRRRRPFPVAPEWLPNVGAIVFAAAAIVDALNAPAGLPAYALSHERIFIGVLALALPLGTRFALVAKMSVVVALVVAFSHYATATAVIAAIAALGYSLLRHLRMNPIAKLAILFPFAIGLAWAGSDENVRGFFYEGFGRVDNSSTRILLWSQATQVIENSPLWGGGATHPVTALGYVNGKYQEVPLHNSILSMTVVAGLIAVGLLIASLLLLISRDFLKQPTASTQMFGPALIAAATTLTVNPILDALASSMAFYAIVMSMTLSQGMGSQREHMTTMKPRVSL